jgi:outer membrane lipoprotein-sorting protein
MANEVEAEAEAEVFLQLVSQRYEQIVTFQADFRQTNSWASMDKKLESSGRLYYDAENLILRYSQPQEQVLKIYQDEISIYDATKNQLIISENQDVSLQPLEILQQYWDISDIYLLEGENSYSVKLEYPSGKVEATVIDRLIYDIVIEDSSGNRVGYYFQNIALNQELSADIFEISLDEDCEIIDLRK